MPKPEGDYLVIKGRIIELDSEMREIMEEIEIAGGVLVKGRDVGAAGRYISLKDDLIEESGEALAQQQ